MYLQTHGTAMGTKVAVDFANIETELHQTAFLEKVYCIFKNSFSTKTLIHNKRFCKF